MRARHRAFTLTQIQASRCSSTCSELLRLTCSWFSWTALSGQLEESRKSRRTQRASKPGYHGRHGPRRRCPWVHASSPLHPSWLSGARQPLPSLSHRHIWAICILQPREDTPARALPHELSDTQRNRLRFLHRATSHFAKPCGAQIPSGHTWVHPKTACPSRELCELLFCFCRVRRCSIHGSSQRSFPQIPSARVSSKAAQPCRFCTVWRSSVGLWRLWCDFSGNPVNSPAFERDFCRHTHSFKCLIASRNRI